VIKFIFYPIALILHLVTKTRNLLYDLGILKSEKFSLPIISIGNLSLGGTGKSPHIMYLIELLKDRYTTATISRGYGRKTKGFLLANEQSNAKEIGDEPFQFYKRYGKIISVCVGEKRAEATKKIINKINPEVILLDDAFQHRQIKPSFSILLTEYNDLYCQDFIFPVGRLRESRNGYKRASIIVVSKCPKNLQQNEREAIIEKLNFDKQKKEVFFSTIAYSDQLLSNNKSKKMGDIRNTTVLLVCGIANPSLFYAYIKQFSKEVILMEFPDHHDFSAQEIKKIMTVYDSIVGDKIIITTEKDFMRLEIESKLKDILYYLPIDIVFTNKEKFDAMILNHVATK
jgi:tetraacyldisaccharide 4'-kinase